MNLYHISQTEVTGWDTFSDAVVAAETEQEAREIHPCEEWGNGEPSGGKNSRHWEKSWYWCSTPEDVKVRLLGKAVNGTKRGVICASFHAG